MRQLVYPAQLGTQYFGNLMVMVTSLNTAKPIKGASVRISFTGDPESTIEQITTNDIGQTQAVQLTTPPIEYSMEPSDEQPYSQYTLRIQATGYETIEIAGVEVFPEQIAIQEVQLRSLEGNKEKLYVIPPHTLYGDYPPKIAEDEIKRKYESSEIVLSGAVIPEYIVVHDGPPTDKTASNYFVKYKDYIKNVASCEIYATWPEATIRANILAIQSFTLNRVYTEWYRNKGYNFVITSSTAFDHKWIPGHNIFKNISIAVDTVFANYLSRPSVKQPILTQYCDGNKTQCPNWMTI